MREQLLALAALGAVAASASAAGPPEKPFTLPKPATSSAKEPLAKSFSLDKGAQFLDAAALNWTQGRNCGSCHTNVAYLMARGALKENARAELEVRKFFEGRVAGWDSGKPGDKPRWDTEVVVTGVLLAFHDAQTTGKLHPLTRKALDRMWTLQQKNGAWNWLKCNWPPMEHDDYFGAVFAAVGVGAAPDGYAKTEKAREGLARLRAYLKKTPTPTLHHKAWLLWGSKKVDGLMKQAERDAAVKELRGRQRGDGGWSLPSLGDWKGNDGRKNDPDAPSDGYGTGLVVYVLRQAGVSADDAAVRRGVAWLKANQRASGRWFTQSLNADRAHFITHAGSAWAVLALKACE
jgi:squalene-hopene/tetraprenyl-beta-curcumene cyclase